MKMTPLSSVRSATSTSRQDARTTTREQTLLRERADLRGREVALEQQRTTLERERAAFEAEREAHREDQREQDDASAFGLARDLGTAVRRDRLARNPSGMAAQILAAGRMRRGEMTAELPRDPQAKAIILSAMRRRGEPISSADAQFLDAYCVKMENDRVRRSLRVIGDE